MWTLFGVLEFHLIPVQAGKHNMPLQVRTGAVLAGFRLKSLLGEGAMGTVYLAEETTTGRRVAVKLLAPELACDERFRRRFLRETELAANLDHPHIVPTLASGEEDGTLYLAMAYVDGPDLRAVLRREGRLEPERALDLVEQVAGALDAAHEAGLVHRDVKPGNILVAATPEGEDAYVCDFGLARHVSSVSSLTSDRGFVGTIDYVPPEQIEGGTVDRRADVYSLGCVLYECLAGARPFDRDSELSVLFAHLNDPPPRLTDLRPDLPAAFDTVFETALAKSPGDRYATCGELAATARAALRGEVLQRRRRRRTRRILVAAAIVAVASAATAGVLLTRSEPARHGQALRTLALRPDALNLVDARTARVAGSLSYGSQVPPSLPAVDVAFTKRSAWLLLVAKQRLVRFDLRTRKQTHVVRLPWLPGGRLAAGGGLVWVTQDGGPAVWGIEERSGKVSRRFSLAGDSGTGIAYGDGSLWLAHAPGIVRVDPSSGRIVGRVATPGQPGATRWLVFADGALWMVRADNGLVVKVDPGTNRVVRETPLHGFASDLAVRGGLVWVSIVPDGAADKLTENDLSVEGSSAVGPDPERISAGGGYLWIANTAAKSLSRLALGTGTKTAFAARSEPTVVAYGDGLLWTGAAPEPAPLAPVGGQELRISTPTQNFDTDPAHAGGPTSVQYLYATCANLLDYPDSAGRDGTQLRPEIAAAMPTVSNGGRTYTFRIRRGFLFSPPSNEPVTAETFRHTIERTLAPSQGHGWPFGAEILGAAAYSAGKARHISGIAVHGNVLSITLVRPAGDFLKRISMPNFCPVPIHGPLQRSNGAIPSAGPYYVAASSSEQIVLLRNPNYRAGRPRHSARIVYTSYRPTPQAVALTDRGAIDYLPPDFDNYSLLTPGGLLDQRYGPGSANARAGRQRYFREPMPYVDDLVFNTRQPLFRQERLRRAVNYALDRRALARAFYDDPNDQILPPGVPGRRARPLYPLSPDLATARRLAGRDRRHAVLYACPPQPRIEALVRANLASIGMSVSVDESSGCLQGEDPARDRADLILGSLGLGPADLDPAPFFDMAIGGAYNFPRPGPGPWTSPAFRVRLERARALRGHSRIAAYARLQQKLLRAAPLAVYGSFVDPGYFSPRVGCKVFQAAYRIVDLGLLCVRQR
jgi:serine/threonine-protein kinase